MTELSKLGKAALAYAQRYDWAVFPLAPRDKMPLITKKDGGRGCLDATTDQEQIRRWWGKWPAANVGVACGPSGLVVIDADASKGGPENWAALKEELGMNGTGALVSLTGGGGQHLVYHAPENEAIHNSAGALGAGIDVRGDGGYIVVAPSVHPSGNIYAWEVSAHPEDRKPAALPAPLLALLLEIRRERFALPDALPEGAKDDNMFRFGCQLRARGLTELEIAAAMEAVFASRGGHPADAGPAYCREKAAAICQRYPAGAVFFRDLETAEDEGLYRRCTDIGNGQRFADQYGKAVRYSYTWKRWLHWTGKYWEVDGGSEIDGWAKETARSISAEAANIQDADVQEAVEKWARSSEGKAKHAAMLFMAQSEPGIPVLPQDLDADPWALNINNGTINLQTGQLLAHDPARLITKLAPVDYEPQATCPLWLSFLDRIMGGNQELIGFLQRAIGYALTGSIKEQVIFILHGIGANGKSSFLEAISSLLDDYAARTPTQTLLLKRGNTIPNDIARLKGARFVTITEVEAGRRLAEGLVKQMTGGEKMVARFLNAEFFEFGPEFKLFLATNHKPEIRGTDHAIWRRIRLIPFEVVIPDDEQDKGLPGKLRQELPGILNWALAGCLDWQKDGLRAPQAVTDATNRYRQDMDLLADFLTDRCYEKPSITTTVSAMFKAYTAWADESNEKALTKRAFGLRLRERGFSVKRGTDGVRLWQSIGLIDRPNQTEMEF